MPNRRRTIVLTLLAVAGVATGTLVVRRLEKRLPPPAAVSLPTSDTSRRALASATGQARPPKFQSRGAGAPVLDPRAPRYDPVTFVGLVKTDDLHAQEPRIEPWATEVETWLGRHLQSDLAKMMPELQGLAIDCKASACRFSWRAGEPDAELKMRRLLQALYPPSMISTEGGAIYATYLGGILKTPPQDSRALFAELQRRRRANLDRIHAGQHYPAAPSPPLVGTSPSSPATLTSISSLLAAFRADTLPRRHLTPGCPGRGRGRECG